MLIAKPFRIVNIGDSVPWGQGLREAQKFDTMIQEVLKADHPGGVTLERLAHSGAVIGFHPASGGPAPGEVPVALPTVADQCDAFDRSPRTVDLILVNGGINDVGVATILNPFAILPTLGSRIESACHDRMLALLNKVRAKFTKPSCKILVTGYYKILSSQSDPLGLRSLLQIYGIATPDFLEEDALLDPIVDRCEQFFRESNQHLSAAVDEAGDVRIRFVPSGFTDANAVFVPGTSLLFGLNEQLGPEDPVAEQRRPQCDLAFPGLGEIANRAQCHRASAGHPNPAGSVQYRKQILAALV